MRGKIHLLLLTMLGIIKKFTSSSALQAGVKTVVAAAELSSLTSRVMMPPTNRSQVLLLNHQKPGGCNYINCKARSAEKPRGLYPQGVVQMVNRA